MHTDYFNKDNVKVPSVTTVIGLMHKEGLIEWANRIGRFGINYTKFLNDKANFGSIVHELIEADLNKREPVLFTVNQTVEDAKELVKKFKVAADDLQIANAKTEISMSCDTYGGTADIVCDIVTQDGPVTVLGDFKTSKSVYMSQFIQLGGYLNLIKINMPDVYEKISQCVIFSITADKITVKYISKENCEKYFTRIFLILLDLYYAWEDIKQLNADTFKSKTY